jgi:hypothetical protein
MQKTKKVLYCQRLVLLALLITCGLWKVRIIHLRQHGMKGMRLLDVPTAKGGPSTVHLIRVEINQCLYGFRSNVTIKRQDKVYICH